MKKINLTVLFLAGFTILVVTSASQASAHMDDRLLNTVLAPVACTGLGGDTDDDNICDNWEPGTNMDVNYPAVGSNHYIYHCDADPSSSDSVCPRVGTRDIFVEVDCITGQCPSPAAIDLVKSAFSAATDASGRPFALHVQMNENLDPALHNSGATIATSETRFPGSNTVTPDQRGFDQIKAKHFGTCV